jgi:hypothetical protein
MLQPDKGYCLGPGEGEENNLLPAAVGSVVAAQARLSDARKASVGSTTGCVSARRYVARGTGR